MYCKILDVIDADLCTNISDSNHNSTYFRVDRFASCQCLKSHVMFVIECGRKNIGNTYISHVLTQFLLFLTGFSLKVVDSPEQWGFNV